MSKKKQNKILYPIQKEREPLMLTQDKVFYNATPSPTIINKLEVDKDGKLIKMQYKFTSAFGNGLL